MAESEAAADSAAELSAREYGSLGESSLTGTSGGRLARDAWWVHRFEDPSLEWRRLFAETLGTFLLVLAGAGAAVVSAASHVAIGRAAAVSAPGLTVLAVILFMGAVSGAHLNPVVSIAFAARGDFPWRRVRDARRASGSGRSRRGFRTRARSAQPLGQRPWRSK